MVMNTKKYEIGDFVELRANNNMYLKRGIVIEVGKHHFCVKWTSYNKGFYCEIGSKSDSIFRKLNQANLLGISYYHKNQIDLARVIILNKGRSDVMG